MTTISKLSKEEILNLLNTYSTLKDILEHLQVNLCGGARKTFAKIIKKFNIDLTDFKQKSKLERVNRMMVTKKILNPNPFCENLFINGKLFKNFELKKALIKMGRAYMCEKCNNPGIHLGEELILQLDHIDGNPYNNLKENLRFLCPNCHSQTPTFGWKNKK